MEQKIKMLYPIIPFNMIVDTDVGLVRMINEKYHREDIFYKGMMETPLKYLIYFLYTRRYENPLSILMEYDLENTSVIDEYYKQFMETEYEDILNYSTLTHMYKAVSLFLNNTDNIKPYILCKNSLEIDVIRGLDFGNGKPLILEGTYGDINLDTYDPLYFKYFSETIPILTKVKGVNIYIANYQFNFIWDEESKKYKLPQLSVLLAMRNDIKIIDTYRIDPSYIPND